MSNYCLMCQVLQVLQCSWLHIFKPNFLNLDSKSNIFKRDAFQRLVHLHRCVSYGLQVSTRLGVDRIKPWIWVRIDLGSDSRGFDIGPGLDIRHLRDCKQMMSYNFDTLGNRYLLCHKNIINWWPPYLL